MTCPEKIPYATRKQALTAMHNPFPPHDRPLRVYKCPHCHFWHLTSQELRSAS